MQQWWTYRMRKCSVLVTVLQKLELFRYWTGPIGDRKFLSVSKVYARISSGNGGLIVQRIWGGVSIHPLSIVLPLMNWRRYRPFPILQSHCCPVLVSILALVCPLSRRLAASISSKLVKYQWAAMVDLSLENNCVRICPLSTRILVMIGLAVGNDTAL
jgi:hypothetical protein